MGTAGKRIPPAGTAVGHLIVSAPAAFGRMHVAPHAPAFLADNPEAADVVQPDRPRRGPGARGLRLSIRIGGAVDPNFVAVKLATNRRVVCGTPAYFERHGKPKTLEDLPRHNCLAFNLQGGQNRGWYFRATASGRDAGRGNLDCNDGELLHRLGQRRAGARLALDVGNPAATGDAAN